MNPLNLKTLKLMLLGMSISSIVLGAEPLAAADTSQSIKIKSYFLLKLGLATDPLDLQNYLNALQFKNQLQQFTQDKTSHLAAFNSEQSAVLNRALMDAFNGDLDKADQAFSRIVLWSVVRNDQELLMDMYRLRSEMMQLKTDHKRAISYQNQVFTIANSTKNLTAIAHSYLQTGKIKSLQSEFPEAEEYLIRKALPAFSRLRDRQGMVTCYREIADMYLRAELFSQAKWFYLQSLTLARQISDQTGTVQALIEIGQLKYDIADFEAALKDWQEAEQIAIRSHDLPLLLKLKFNLVQVSQHLKETHAIEKYGREFEQLKDILLNPIL